MSLSKKILAAVLVLINFLLLHYVVSSLPIRFDLTEDDIYTLSPSTESLLGKLEEPVTIDFYTNKSLAELPAWFKNFSDRIEQMLEQYESAAGGKIYLNVIDPKPDTEEEERAIAAGLNSTELPNGDRVFLGMVVAQGDSEKIHPFFNWNRETFLEYDISKTVYETQLLTKPRLGLITSLPLKAPPYPVMPGQPAPEDQFVVAQLENQFEVVEVAATDETLPPNLDLLFIAHPQDLTLGLRYSIDQYALSGKPIFLALDPSSAMEREQGRQQMMMGQMSAPTPSDLPELLAAWGIEYDPSTVVLDRSNSLSRGRFTQPAWLIFQNDFINRSLLPSSELEALMMLEPGQLKLAEGATGTWEPILTTSSDSYAAQSMMLQFTQPDQLVAQSEPIGEPAVIAGLLTGEIKTAFPEGPPSNEQNEEAPPTPAESLTSGNATILIVADSDFLLDQFSIQRSNFLGMQQIQPLNDNQSFVANFVEYLGGSSDLIGIRGKASTSRPFDVVQEMETEAQRQYQSKLEAVEAQLQDINAELARLLSEQTDSGVIYASPEMSAMIQRNQEKQAELRGEIREIRRNLRQGIETLGTIIGAINLLWAPIALLLFALLFNRARKSH